MGLLGALLGGGIGLMLGGPIGAMLLGALGSRIGDAAGPAAGEGQRRFVGRCPQCGGLVSFLSEGALVCPRCGARLAATGPDWRGGHGAARTSSTRADEQSAFMVALISLAAKVAKADGAVSREEIAAFDRFLRDELGMPAEERRLAARIFNEARDSTVPAGAFARQIRQLMAARPERLRDLISLLIKIATADGRLQPAEETLIRSIARDLGLGERDYQEAKALLSRGSIGASYALLGVDESASEIEIKKAYRRLAREYHPDTLAAKGLPEDFTRFANEKLQAINEAYERIRKHRGF